MRVSRSIRSTSQRGFTILELIIALAVGASIAAVVNTNRMLTESEDLIAQGTAQYMMVLRDGVIEYQRQHFIELSQNVAVVGVAVGAQLTPTIA